VQREDEFDELPDDARSVRVGGRFSMTATAFERLADLHEIERVSLARVVDVHADGLEHL